MAKTNFVLIDFENVQPKDMALLEGGPFKVKVFLGATQTRIPVALARALQPLGADVEYIQIEGSGSNALDFHIAYYVGRLAAEYADAFFHIISRDTGFDPLIKHLKGQKIFCARSASIAEIPLLKASASASAPADKLGSVIEKLIGQKASKPRTLKTLGPTIKNYFANKLGDDELQQILEQLAGRGIVVVNEGKVTYKLPN